MVNRILFCFVIFLLYTIQHIHFTFVHQFQDQFAEQSVLPRKPGTGKFLRIVFVERFVHKACTRIRIHQHFNARLDFCIVFAGESLHHDTHRPYHIVTDMRSANAFACLTFKEVRIVEAPHKATGILINRIVH